MAQIIKAIKFNTGRQYTQEGQVVVAWVRKEEVDHNAFGFTWYTLGFYDISRQVYGVLENCMSLSEEEVMRGYDNMRYTLQGVDWAEFEEEFAKAKAIVGL